MNEVFIVPGMEECDHLVELLKKNGIPYETAEDPGFFLDNPIFAPPALIVDCRVFNYYEALNWIRRQKGGEGNGKCQCEKDAGGEGKDR